MAAEEERRTISKSTLGRGRYSQSGFRHKGWVSVSVEDREEPDELCQACQKRQVRYVHILQHEDVSEANSFGRLEAGCVCAGYLTEDYVGAAESERRVRNETARKSREIKRDRERRERLRRIEAAQQVSEANRRVSFSNSWVRDPDKATTSRQSTFTVFKRGSGYSLRSKKGGFIVGLFKSEAEAQAYALAVEFKDVVPEYESQS